MIDAAAIAATAACWRAHGVRRWGKSTHGDAPACPDMSLLADLWMSCNPVERVLPVPLAKQGVVPLAVVAILPLLLAAAAQAPTKLMPAALKRLVPV